MGWGKPGWQREAGCGVLTVTQLTARNTTGKSGRSTGKSLPQADLCTRRQGMGMGGFSSQRTLTRFNQEKCEVHCRYAEHSRRGESRTESRCRKTPGLCYGPDCTIPSHQNNKHDSAYAQAHGAITQNTDADWTQHEAWRQRSWGAGVSNCRCSLEGNIAEMETRGVKTGNRKATDTTTRLQSVSAAQSHATTPPQGLCCPQKVHVAYRTLKGSITTEKRRFWLSQVKTYFDAGFFELKTLINFNI